MGPANNAGLSVPSVPSGYVTSFPGTFAAWGTFGSGTIKLQAGYVDGAGTVNWIDITNASFTAAGAVNVTPGSRPSRAGHRDPVAAAAAAAKAGRRQNGY
jgi:hypothetical protein